MLTGDRAPARRRRLVVPPRPAHQSQAGHPDRPCFIHRSHPFRLPVDPDRRHLSSGRTLVCRPVRAASGRGGVLVSGDSRSRSNHGHPVDPADEARHPPAANCCGTSPTTSTSWTATVRWPGYVRIGLYPNMGVTWWTAMIVGPGRPVVESVSYALPVPPAVGWTSLIARVARLATDRCAPGGDGTPGQRAGHGARRSGLGLPGGRRYARRPVSTSAGPPTALPTTTT